MTHSLRARFEGGLLHPMGKVDIPEGSSVEVAIRPLGHEAQLRALLKRVHKRMKGCSPEAIEAEITLAAEEVRAERLGRK